MPTILPTHSSAMPGTDPLDEPVRTAMTPGVVAIAQHASLVHVSRALAAHGTHAVLVVGAGGAALGWVTAEGMLGWIDRDDTLASAEDAISAPATTIDAGASAREAAEMLRAGASHLLVTRAGMPEGVVTALDLVRLIRHP